MPYRRRYPVVVMSILSVIRSDPESEHGTEMVRREAGRAVVGSAVVFSSK
jgi:hypothetical protein